MSNVEQGISNDEVKSLVLFPSAFVIRYSTCPLCPWTDFTWNSLPSTGTAFVPAQSVSQGRRVFCGSLLNFYATR